MKLTKHNGKFWLKAGWPEFAKHYALEIGDLLVFRYEGNSKFRVVIFDMTTVEIDYPFVPPGKGAQEEDISPSRPRKAGEEPPLRSPRDRKRAKAGPNAKPRRDSSSPEGMESNFLLVFRCFRLRCIFALVNMYAFFSCCYDLLQGKAM